MLIFRRTVRWREVVRFSLLLGIGAICVQIGGSADEIDVKTEDVEIAESLTIEEILTEELTQSDYAENKRCIDARRIDEYSVLTDRTVIVEMKHGQKYLINLKRRCPGMKRGSVVVVQQRSNAVFCHGDTIRWRISDIGPHQWGPECMVQGFTEISDHQIRLLKEGIVSGRVE